MNFKKSIPLLLLFMLVLYIGLFFGVRIGEGQYSFYTPHSNYYLKATRDAKSDGYSAGWAAGHKAKQEDDYNSGWSAGYEFCLSENKAIRNDYDEGYDDGYDSGFEYGWAEGYQEALFESSPD